MTFHRASPAAPTSGWPSTAIRSQPSSPGLRNRPHAGLLGGRGWRRLGARSGARPPAPAPAPARGSARSGLLDRTQPPARMKEARTRTNPAAPAATHRDMSRRAPGARRPGTPRNRRRRSWICLLNGTRQANWRPEPRLVSTGSVVGKATPGDEWPSPGPVCGHRRMIRQRCRQRLLSDVRRANPVHPQEASADEDLVDSKSS